MLTYEKLIYGKVDIENIPIMVGGKEIQASFSATCKGIYSHEDAVMYDWNGTGYPGCDEVELDSVSVDDWLFFDDDGNEIDLNDNDMKIAEEQMAESVWSDDSLIKWEYE